MSTFTECPIAAILNSGTFVALTRTTTILLTWFVAYAVVIGIWVVIMGLVLFMFGVSVVPGANVKRLNFTVLASLGLFSMIIFILLMFFVPVLNFTGC